MQELEDEELALRLQAEYLLESTETTASTVESSSSVAAPPHSDFSAAVRSSSEDRASFDSDFELAKRLAEEEIEMENQRKWQEESDAAFVAQLVRAEQETERVFKFSHLTRLPSTSSLSLLLPELKCSAHRNYLLISLHSLYILRNGSKLRIFNNTTQRIPL